MSAAAPEVTVRPASEHDLPAIFAVARRSLGWEDGPATEQHFAWKHFENPFGPSPMWVAEVGERIAGFRTFLRWEFCTGTGEVRRAVRAVDTATDPDFQGRGIFTTLTLGALDELRADGVDFVFNTPNDQSRPGYLKMGWQVIGRLPLAVRPTHLTGLVQIARARLPATRGALPTTAGPGPRDLAPRAPGEGARPHDPTDPRVPRMAVRARSTPVPGGHGPGRPEHGRGGLPPAPTGPRGRSRDLRDARPPG
jgi:GNAT superfamily N-acetyltransferase